MILSTHIVSDIEASATALAVLDKGRLLFRGRPEALLVAAHGKVWDWTVEASALAWVRATHRVCNSLRRPDGIRVRIVAEQAPAARAEAVVPGLEDAYMYLLAQQSQAGA